MTTETLRAEIPTCVTKTRGLASVAATLGRYLMLPGIESPVRVSIEREPHEGHLPPWFDIFYVDGDFIVGRVNSKANVIYAKGSSAVDAVEEFMRAYDPRRQHVSSSASQPYVSDLGALLGGLAESAVEFSQTVDEMAEFLSGSDPFPTADEEMETAANDWDVPEGIAEDHLVMDHRCGSLVMIFLARFHEHAAQGLELGRWYSKPANEPFATWAHKNLRSYPDFASALACFGPVTIGSLSRKGE